MATTFLDMLRTKVALQLGLLDPESARAALVAADGGGASFLGYLEASRGVDRATIERVERHARRCQHLKSESIYLRLLRGRQLIPEAQLQPIMWEVRNKREGKTLGETLVGKGLLPQGIHGELAGQVRHSLETEDAKVTTRYRERGWAGIERESPAVKQVIAEEAATPPAPGTSAEGTQILPQSVAAGITPLQGKPVMPAVPAPLPATRGAPPPVLDEAETTQDLPPGTQAALQTPQVPPELANTGLDEKYQIIKKCGEGGMGAVYLAYAKDDAAQEQPMALKVVLGRAKSKAAAERFKREILATSFCGHENIIEIYDAAETKDGSYYMAMEFIEGDELADLLKREGPLPLDRVVLLMEQALEAMQAMHGANIVHRDIKPQNFRISRDASGRERLKIMDFGIARILDAEDSGAGDQFYRTMGGKITGSPAYIAPESITEPEVDGRADLYSLGISIFRIATGRLPFVAKEPTEYLPMHLYHKPPPLRQLLPHAPEELEQFVAKLLEKARDNRFQGAGDALEFLRTKVKPKLIREAAPAGPGVAQPPQVGESTPMPAAPAPMPGAPAPLPAMAGSPFAAPIPGTQPAGQPTQAETDLLGFTVQAPAWPDPDTPVAAPEAAPLPQGGDGGAAPAEKRPGFFTRMWRAIFGGPKPKQPEQPQS